MPFAESFLEYPDLFPQRRSGDVWGARQVALDFAGGPYLFAGLNDAQEGAIRGRYPELWTVAEGKAPPAVESLVFRVAEREFRPFELDGRESDIDFDYEAQAVRFAGLSLMGRLDLGSGVKGALWTPAAGEEAFLGVFENYFRILVAYRLLECGGVLLHSAGVIDDEGAYLFLGRSGAGKTTIARLSLEVGREVLSDDLNALCREASGTVVAKLPFAGDFGDSPSAFGSYPLRSLCRIQKGKEHAVRPMTAARSMAVLVACAPFVNGDPHRLDSLVANLESLIAEVPACVLTFALDRGFWDTLTAHRESR